MAALRKQLHEYGHTPRWQFIASFLLMVVAVIGMRACALTCGAFGANIAHASRWMLTACCTVFGIRARRGARLCEGRDSRANGCIGLFRPALSLPGIGVRAGIFFCAQNHWVKSQQAVTMD